MIVEVYYTGTHMANIHLEGANNIIGALETAHMLTQNIEGSWSRGPTFEDGDEPNLDYDERIEVLVPLEEYEGRLYGHRSSMIGDLFVIDGQKYEVDFSGFKEID